MKGASRIIRPSRVRPLVGRPIVVTCPIAVARLLKWSLSSMHCRSETPCDSRPCRNGEIHRITTRRFMETEAPSRKFVLRTACDDNENATAPQRSSSRRFQRGCSKKKRPRRTAWSCAAFIERCDCTAQHSSYKNPVRQTRDFCVDQTLCNSLYIG